MRLAKRFDTRRDDEALARECAHGDGTAMATLYDRYREPVTRTIRRLVGDDPEVDDLVQQTFIEVVRGRAIYDGRATVQSWLLGIANNKVRHHRRAAGRRSRLLSEMASSVAAAVRGPTEQDLTEQTHARRQLFRAHQALRRLNDSLRDSFVLCEIEGLSARQAGEILGTSEMAVWKRVSKAREALRCALRADPCPR
jgi:RNA polymerase sigma-70 factor (ECF subfamily)